MIEIPDFLEEIIDNGIQVLIYKNDGQIYFDLNLCAKSHMYLHKIDQDWFVEMRYNKRFKVATIDDLKKCARHGMHGREYIHSDWAKLLDL